MERTERGALRFDSSPAVIGGAACVGKTEGEGPLRDSFDILNPDDGLGCKSWEAAEAALARQAAEKAIEKCGLTSEEIDLAFGGDLLNQCTATTFGLQTLGIPHAGLYGACATFALALLLAAMAVDGGRARYALAEASSHFCAAEKQYRYPLEYGGQRPQTAQRTVTGAGACVIGKSGAVRIAGGMVGRITDLGVKDAANMGAAMAPAAAQTTAAYLRYVGARPVDFDMILTGDLGRVGASLFLELTDSAGINVEKVYADCGDLIYDAEKQDAHAGGSGCGCSAAVFSGEILRRMRDGKLDRLLLVGTGALMSPVTSLQKERIPCIAHAVELTVKEEARADG